MPRWLAVRYAATLLRLIVDTARTLEDPWGAAMAKLSEGSLWTGLAGLPVLCVAMTLRAPAARQT